MDDMNNPMQQFYQSDPVPYTPKEESSDPLVATAHVEPPRTETYQRQPSISVPLFISRMGIPIDKNNVTFVVEKALRELDIKDDDYQIVLYTQFYDDKRYVKFDGQQRLSKIIDLLRSANIKHVVVDDKVVFNNDNNGRTKIVLLWNGTDNDIPKLAENLRFARVKYSLKLVDPKMKSIWSHIKNVDCIVVSTNGCYKLGKSSAYATCGRGSALQASVIIPSFREALGNKLKALDDQEFGNATFLVTNLDGVDIVAFPTKPREIVVNETKSNVPDWMRDRCTVGERLPGYRGKADKRLIDKGMTQFAELINTHHWKSIIMVKIGCGEGKLDWSADIVPIFKNNPAINQHLNRISIADFSNGRTPLIDILS